MKTPLDSGGKRQALSHKLSAQVCQGATALAAPRGANRAAARDQGESAVLGGRALPLISRPLARDHQRGSAVKPDRCIASLRDLRVFAVNPASVSMCVPLWLSQSNTGGESFTDTGPEKRCAPR